MCQRNQRKQQTRERIIDSAGRMFRADGYKGAGVDAVMASAGLTAGGFYAHFQNKDDLLIEALARIARNPSPSLSQADIDSGEALLRWVERYLSSKHRDHPDAGCVLPTLAGEIPRQSKAVRTAFTRVLRDYITALSRHMPAETGAKREEQAIAVLSAMAGAMLLARAVNDEAISDRILAVVRETIAARLIAPPSSTRRTRRKPALSR